MNWRLVRENFAKFHQHSGGDGGGVEIPSCGRRIHYPEVISVGVTARVALP